MSFRPLSLLMPGGLWGRHQVLLFHRVLDSPDTMLPDEWDVASFDELVKRLGKVFNVLPLNDAIDLAQRRKLPSASISITFDDGYADNFTYALPILEKHGVSATFFIASGYLNGGRMWNDTLIETARRLPSGDFEYPLCGGGTVEIRGDDDRREIAYRAIRDCKHLPASERAHQVEIFSRLQSDPLPDDLMMNTQQLLEMADSEFAEIGAHTRSHPILANCNDDIAREEITHSVEDLAQVLGFKPRLFAYPNGKRGRDYLPSQARIVQEVGLKAAVATDWGVLKSDTDLYQIPRFTPWSRNTNRFVFDLFRARFGLL